MSLTIRFCWKLLDLLCWYDCCEWFSYFNWLIYCGFCGWAASGGVSCWFCRWLGCFGGILVGCLLGSCFRLRLLGLLWYGTACPFSLFVGVVDFALDLCSILLDCFALVVSLLLWICCIHSSSDCCHLLLGVCFVVGFVINLILMLYYCTAVLLRLVVGCLLCCALR